VRGGGNSATYHRTTPMFFNDTTHGFENTKHGRRRCASRGRRGGRTPRGQHLDTHNELPHGIIFHTILDATLLTKDTTRTVTHLLANQRNDLPGDARQRPHTTLQGTRARHSGSLLALLVGLQPCLTGSERVVQTFHFTRARNNAERARKCTAKLRKSPQGTPLGHAEQAARSQKTGLRTESRTHRDCVCFCCFFMVEILSGWTGVAAS
jgi:hypothetical protein